MAVRGLFASHSGIVGERVETLSGRILSKSWAGTTPLLAISAGMPEDSVKDTSWSWVEDTHISGNSIVTAAASNVATTITVSDSSIWTKNSVLLVETTGEHLYVTATPTATSITVRRGLGGTTPTAIAANATLQLIGTAFAEGGGKPEPIATNGDSYTNIVQIFKQGWAVSGTAQAIEYVTGSKLANSKAQAIAFHAENIERSFMFGRKAIFKDSDNKEVRLSNGIIPSIESFGGLVVSANYGSVAGQMSIKGLQNFMRRIFDKNAKGLPNERMALTSSAVLEVIQDMVRKDTRYDIKVSDKVFGLDVWSLTFLGHTLKLAIHPLMSENAYWSKELYVFHPGLIRKRVLRKTWTQEFGARANTNAGVDADEGFIADELGFEIKGAELHGIMRNITTAVAS